ncbi:MAG: type II toxin-antitoxin system VapC family toxin [Gemmatimonadota bacterium]|nr:type II toxin-antitoxin system VapC family toxin [Gemmatimonadota bacterium]
MRFWDTSALVPLVIRQSSSSKADRWYAEEASVAIWTLATVEIASALWRLRREDALTEKETSAAELRAEELASASYIVADVDSVKTLAARLLRVHALRAADALQLGAALVWASGLPQGKTLHTLDERLALAARREGFSVP